MSAAPGPRKAYPCSPDQLQWKLNDIRKVLEDSESGEISMTAALDIIHELSEYE